MRSELKNQDCMFQTIGFLRRQVSQRCRWRHHRRCKSHGRLWRKIVIGILASCRKQLSFTLFRCKVGTERCIETLFSDANTAWVSSPIPRISKWRCGIEVFNWRLCDSKIKGQVGRQSNVETISKFSGGLQHFWKLDHLLF